ncbi:hypothetical protein NL676_003646 [Syzygium grande]|nr:hypothetical protein NL676_003646 [Syzygium grande]
MAPRNPGGGSKVPPPPVAVPLSVALPPEASAPPDIRWPSHSSTGLITIFCPCVTFGQNAEIIDRGSTSCACAGAVCCLIFHFFYCSFWYTCTYRTKLRGLYSIPGDQCGDCFVHLLCVPCALCQEYRELKNRGFNPLIGWVANEERRTRQVGIVVPPSVPGGMTR